MVQPTLWGPGAWNMLFSCAWTAKPKQMAELRALVFELVPTLLPCDKCRKHYPANARKAFRAVPVVTTPEHMFRWLHELKRLVAADAAGSLPFVDLVERYKLHGGVVDEVQFCDMLVFFAIAAEALRKHDALCRMCAILAALLPLPSDSGILDELARVKPSSVVSGAVRCARTARTERGAPLLNTKQYRSFTDDRGV